MSEEVEVNELPLCDLCKEEGFNVLAQYDGKTLMGPWAYMCAAHWRRWGPGQLGTGFGQKLVLRKKEETGE